MWPKVRKISTARHSVLWSVSVRSYVYACSEISRLVQVFVAASDTKGMQMNAGVEGKGQGFCKEDKSSHRG